MVKKISLAIVAVLLSAGAAGAQTSEPRLVTMTGYGTVQGTPDRAWVTVGVETRDAQTKVAQEQTAIAMDHIQQRLRALGIPDASIRTSSFNVTQDWEFIQGRRNLRGYVVSNQIEVKVDDITKVSAIIDGSIAAGANVIHGVRWDIMNREALEQQALREAFEDARSRAGVIAATSGARLGAVYAVQESRAGQVRPMTPMRYQAGLAGQGAMAESVTVVNPGEMDIRAVVTVSFLIQS
ncbi:MAG: SIMPL domain-containing protein [Vicinamibacterales bacterium]